MSRDSLEGGDVSTLGMVTTSIGSRFGGEVGATGSECIAGKQDLRDTPVMISGHCSEGETQFYQP